MKRLHQAGVKAEKLPFVLDGTWHPGRSDNLFAWMGRRGMFGDTETDNGVMTKLEEVAIRLKALEKLLAFAQTQGKNVTTYADPFKELCRKLVLAQVSDATGWNPWKGEVDYSLNLSKEVLRDANNMIGELAGKLDLGPYVKIDLASGEVSSQDKADEPAEHTATDPQWETTVTAEGFDVTTIWSEAAEFGPDVYLLTINLVKKDPKKYTMQIDFKLDTDKFVYTPAMLDNEFEEIPFSDIGTDPFTVGLANGMMALGDKVFLVEDTRTIHLCPHVDAKGGKVWFRDETINYETDLTYKFYLLKNADAQKAVAFAKRLNITPVVVLGLK